MDIERQIFYNKFHQVLRENLINGNVCFPDNIKVNYNEFTAYRVISRKPEEADICINKDDFMSQMQLNKIKQVRPPVDPNDIGYYSCSLFTDVEQLKIIMRLPRPKKHLIKGLVKDKNGVCDSEDKKSHINWWLYESADPSEDFELFEVE